MTSVLPASFLLLIGQVGSEGNGMKITIFLIGVAITSVVFMSCSDIGSNSIPLPFENVNGQDCLQVPYTGPMVIGDDSTWQSFWDQYSVCWGESAKTPPPTIDFQQNMVVAIFWGEHCQGCRNAVDAIDIYRVNSSHVEVYINPLPDLGPCFMITYPLQVVTIAKTPLPVIFTGNIPQ
jgi:hypothetical protein